MTRGDETVFFMESAGFGETLLRTKRRIIDRTPSIMSSDEESPGNKRRRLLGGSKKERSSTSSSTPPRSRRHSSADDFHESARRSANVGRLEMGTQYPYGIPQPDPLPPPRHYIAVSEQQDGLSTGNTTSLLQRLQRENEYLQHTLDRSQAMNLRGGNNHPVLQQDLQRRLARMTSEQTHASGLLGGDASFRLDGAAATYDQLMRRHQAPTPRQQAIPSSDALSYDALLMNRRQELVDSRRAQQLPSYGTNSGDLSEYLRTNALPTSNVARMPPQGGGGTQNSFQRPSFGNEPRGYSTLSGMIPQGIDPYLLDAVRGGSNNLAQRYPLATAAVGHGLVGGPSQVNSEVERDRLREAMVDQGLNLLNQANLLSRLAPPPTVETDPNALTLYRSEDDRALSPYQCLVRKQIELFAADVVDVESNAQGRNRPIVLGQVGIRCLYCSAQHPKDRARGGTYYPSKLNGFYQAAQNMAATHLCKHCIMVPDFIRQQLLVLKERKSSAGGGKDYWAESAKALGVIEDEKMGVLRFAENDKEKGEDDDEEGEVKDDTKVSAAETEET